MSASFVQRTAHSTAGLPGHSIRTSSLCVWSSGGTQELIILILETLHGELSSWHVFLGHQNCCRSCKDDCHTDIHRYAIFSRCLCCSILADRYDLRLTLSPPIPLRLYTLPYWSNPPFLIFDIWALWRSGLSARAPECQKLKIVG